MQMISKYRSIHTVEIGFSTVFLISAPANQHQGNWMVLLDWLLLKCQPIACPAASSRYFSFSRRFLSNILHLKNSVNPEQQILVNYQKLRLRHFIITFSPLLTQSCSQLETPDLMKIYRKWTIYSPSIHISVFMDSKNYLWDFL